MYDIPFMCYYIKTKTKETVLGGALTVLLWAGIVVYLNELQLEGEYADREEV